MAPISLDKALSIQPPGAPFVALARALQNLSRAADRSEVVEVIRLAAREISGASGISIVMREGDECLYLAEDAAYELWTGQRFPIEDCISGWVMRTGQQVAIDDIYLDSRVPGEFYRGTPVRRLVMTPVGEPQPFAALGAYWTEHEPIAPAAAEAMTALAAAMSVTLRNLEATEALREDAARSEQLYQSSQQLVRAHADAERHQALLIHELNHRVKNTLAIIQGIARQSLRSTDSLDVAREAFESRLHTLAAAHTLLTQHGWQAVSVRQLISACLAPFDEARSRFDLDGPDMRLAPRIAVAFALALHELSTNAAKYGALTNDAGTVSIRWWLGRRPDGPRLKLLWREIGGPPVTPPKSRGFGSRLLERGLARELEGSVELQFAKTGVICRIDAPAPLSSVALHALSMTL